jgi:predicted ATPase
MDGSLPDSIARMFEALRLKNFRGFADTGEVDLACLTIIVGPNNAGKSSLLHSLLLLRQTVETRRLDEPLVTSGSFVDVGSFDDIVRGGSANPHRSIGIGLRASRNFIDQEGAEWGHKESLANRLELDFELDRIANQIRLKQSRFLRDSDLRVGVRWDEGTQGYRLQPAALAKGASANMYNFLPAVDRSQRTLESLDVESLTKWSESLAQRTIWLQLLQSIDHIAPLRIPVPRYTVLGRTAGSVSTAGGEALLNSLRSSERSNSAEPVRLISQLDYWVSKRFQMLARLRLLDVDKAGRILALLGDERGGFKDINIANMGEGISQMLPVIASVVTAQANSCLLVEQPEIHLHPAAQADLGDLFVDSVTDQNGPQFLVETHSEHLLLRIRRRVAEGRLSPDKVSVLYVERAGRKHTVRRLPLDEQGSFSTWPAGFFEEGYSEALRLAEAASKRRDKR